MFVVCCFVFLVIAASIRILSECLYIFKFYGGILMNAAILSTLIFYLPAVLSFAVNLVCAFKQLLSLAS